MVPVYPFVYSWNQPMHSSIFVRPSQFICHRSILLSRSSILDCSSLFFSPALRMAFRCYKICLRSSARISIGRSPDITSSASFDTVQKTIRHFCALGPLSLSSPSYIMFHRSGPSTKPCGTSSITWYSLDPSSESYFKIRSVKQLLLL